MLPFKGYKPMPNEDATREHRGAMSAAMYRKLADTPTFTSVSAPLIIASNVLGLQGWGPDPAHGATYYGLRYPGLVGSGDYGVLVQNNGWTGVNAASGQAISLRVNNAETAHITATQFVLTAGKTLAQLGGSNAAYGSLSIDGSKGGYAGIHFPDVARVLMMSAAVQGSYNTAGSWDWYWQNGVLTAGSVPVARITGLANSATIGASGGNVAGTLVYRNGPSGSIVVGPITADGAGVSGGSLLLNDLWTYRSASTGTGVIFFRADRTRYLFFDGSQYVMPNSNLLLNGVTVSSSRAYKQNIRDLPNMRARVMKLRPRLFQFRPEYGGGGDKAGFIYEELESDFPALGQVGTGANGEIFHSLDYNSIFVMNVKATQELVEEVTTLRQRVKSLEDRLAAAGIP